MSSSEQVPTLTLDRATALRHFASFRGPTQSLDQFFNTLYRRYDERFIVGAPALAARTRRRVWDPDSAILQDSTLAELEYPIRTGE